MAENKGTAAPGPGSYHAQNLAMQRALVLANALACFVWLLGLKLEPLLKNLKDLYSHAGLKSLLGAVGIGGQSVAVGLLAVASLATIALSSVIAAPVKHWLVFGTLLPWNRKPEWLTYLKHPLPGCRAFSYYARDDRVDLAALARAAKAKDFEELRKLGPKAQNDLWYGWLKQLEGDHSYIAYNSRIFLLLMESASLVLVMICFLVPILLVAADSFGSCRALFAILAAELLVFLLGARHAGESLVADVLGRVSASYHVPQPSRLKQSHKPARPR